MIEALKKARGMFYITGSQVTITGKIIYLAHDSFESGGGVFTYALQTTNCRIHAKMFYRPFATIFKGLKPEQPFYKGDVVTVRGTLKENKYVDPETKEIISKGCYIVIAPGGIEYCKHFANSVVRFDKPGISVKELETLTELLIEKSRFTPKI